MRAGSYMLAAAAALLIAACTSSETSVTAPTATKCQVTATASPTAFGAGGGNGSLTVSAPRDCTWSANVDASWVALGDRSGQGDATLSYTVSANGAASVRTATVAVEGQTVQLKQDAAPCRYALNHTSDTIGAAGGSLSVDVSTPSGCSWSAASSASWIRIASGQSGSASGTVGLSVAANTGAARVGQVNAGGQTYTVNQDGASGKPPAPSPSPSPSPTPTPTPTPTPAPSPDPGGQEVTFEGIVTNVSGRCPDLTFTVSSWTVATDRSTKFKDISCGDVAKGGRSVSGEGTTDSAGVVQADIVKKAGGHDD